MQANEAVVIENQPVVKMSIVGQQETYPSEYPCDPWHLAGFMSTGFGERELRCLNIKSKLPRVDFTVKVGSTGYIIWSNDLPKTGWTLDSMGRLVGVLDKFRFFQRYNNNCMLVRDINNDGYFTTFDEDELKEFDLLLQQL